MRSYTRMKRIFLEDGNYVVIVDDLSLGFGYFGMFIGLLLFRKNDKLWAQLLRDLTDFEKFEKPENFDSVVRILNVLSMAAGLYACIGTVLFVSIRLGNQKPCKIINEMHDLSEICGLLWLYLFQFGLMALSLEPGYLDFDNLPDTNFTCVGKVIGGYYADLEANCQMFHVCTIGQADEPMDIRFLCLNGTVFDQETRVCERIDEVDCSKSEQFYSLNLELYGNSGPILEESPEISQETEPPSIIIKSTSSTTTSTTTTTKRPTNRPHNPLYYTTIRPPAVTTTVSKPKVVSTHHFPVNAPDIRFNPEEINISLNPGAPPDIRTKHFLQQSFSDSSQDLVNDNVNSGDGQTIKVQKPERLHVSSSTSPKSIYPIDLRHNQNLPQTNENNFAFSDEGYHTEHPQQRQQQFLIQTNSFRHSQSFPPNLEHSANQYHHQHFHSTTAKQSNNYHPDPADTTLRTIYLHSLKPPEIHQHHHYTHHHRTEKPPQRVQIPIPLLPTLPPLTFSSPAPFTLQRHIETKRYTKDHPAPPRIIISASASVSDASGRRLNYSLGTIGAAHILKAPPASYDDYKDSDVVLDPFYHDVPKLDQKRRKRRSTEENEEKINPFEIIKNEKEAVEVLKFLFTWYQSHKATATVPPITSPVTPDIIHKINYEFSGKDGDSTLLTDSSEFHFTNSKDFTSTESLTPEYENSELFKENGRYSIIGGYKNLDSKPNINQQTSFKNLVVNSVEKDTAKLRTGKNQVVGDVASEVVSDIPKITEKMDDSDVTVIKDLKEPYFNPYDYVDDNYEGIVYKENGPNENTTVYSHLPKKEEYFSEQNGSITVNPVVVAKLYKYFNLTRDLAAEDSKTNISSEDITASENNSSQYKEPKLNGTRERTKSEEFLLKDISHIFNDTDTSNKPVKLTEINILSEVHEADENVEDSLTTSKTSTSTSTSTERPLSRKSGIRRGRVRQRAHTENYYGRQKSFNMPFSSTESHNIKSKLEPDNTNSLLEQSLTTRSPSGRSRKRGRSRFLDYHSSTSTTTTASSIENIVTNDSNKENPENYPPVSTSPTITEFSRVPDTTLDILNASTAPTLDDGILNDDITSKNNIKETEKINIFKQTSNSPLEEVSTDKSDSKLQISLINTEKITSENIDFYGDIGHQVIENIPESHEIVIKNEKNERDFHDEKNISLEEIIPEYKTTKITDDQLEANTLTPKNIIETMITTSNPIIETSSQSLINIDDEKNNLRETEKILNIPELTPIIKATENPTYLIKLLRYFVETEMNIGEEETTETSAESYVPLTESQVTTTEKLIIFDNQQTSNTNRAIGHKKSRHRSRQRYSPKANTTGLPTLRDIYEPSNKSTENELPPNNFKITKSEDNLLASQKVEENDSPAAADTPLVSVDSTTKLLLNIPDSELEENVHIKTESQSLETISFLQQNFTDNPAVNPVTNTPIVDTTVTTPLVSFEQPASFGTTLPSITDSTKSVGTNTDFPKYLTQTFESGTRPNQFLLESEPREEVTETYSFYQDLFVVPEATEKSSHASSTKLNDNTDENTETTFFLQSTSIDGRSDQKVSSPSSTNELKEPTTTESIKFDYVTSHDLQDFKTPIEIKQENHVIEPVEDKNTFDQLDLTTLQPDIEIQKSISLPVSILQGTFDISPDINNAQDINNLIPTLPNYETTTTIRTPEKLQEYIQDIEVSTKSIIAKDDQVKLGFTEEYGLTATEPLPVTFITTEATEEFSTATTIRPEEEHVKNPKYSTVPEVHHNATEIIFVKDTEAPKTSENTTSLPTGLPVESPGILNSSHLLQVVVETTTAEPVTTVLSTTRIPYHARRTRPPKRRPYNNHKNQYGRHRFSTELFTNKPPKYDETHYKRNQFTSQIKSENITDAPLYRSATPTRSELKKVSLHTTPLSLKNSRVPSKVSKNYVFNCFGKEKHRFYADPRDCRLFHYCTQGYSKNQLLDLKFVCDQKTFFDDVKLICTKMKPARCV